MQHFLLFLFNKLEALTLEAEETFLDPQEFPGGGSTLTLTHTLTYTLPHSLCLRWPWADPGSVFHHLCLT